MRKVLQFPPEMTAAKRAIVAAQRLIGRCVSSCDFDVPCSVTAAAKRNRKSNLHFQPGFVQPRVVPTRPDGGILSPDFDSGAFRVLVFLECVVGRAGALEAM